ncbi:30S ribosomal protein S18 [candidate division WWE3 bacterium RBG_13_37_7]|uniref:Small ribosomal subunit protein bS18 n=1 Tax=candidate division WWE3 bacterium RBG_13_37_7 TaxID=1802609 RepID=A0A1F4U1C9_UNCKA|nr:MAG: 30S ribosomal protein S18 [candidate division WWE3 bacterium RBG_13_37_7]
MARSVKSKPRTTRTVKRTKKTCYFTETKTKPDYKDVLVLKRYVSERGKILPVSLNGLTAKNQRLLAREIKKARFMALMPYTDKHAI